MDSQIDSANAPADHRDLDKRLAVVESAYVTKDIVVTAQSEMRGWLLVQTLALVMFTGSGFTYSITRMDALERRLDQVELRLDRVEKRLDTIDARLDRIEALLVEQNARSHMDPRRPDK